MEDLTRGMRTPRILDLKMGFTAYNIKKFETQAKKYKESTCSTEGFRFAGFKVSFLFVPLLFLSSKNFKFRHI